MRAGHISAAALLAGPTSPIAHEVPRYCPVAEYTRCIEEQAIDEPYRRQKLREYRSFLARWPELPEWFAAPSSMH